MSKSTLSNIVVSKPPGSPADDVGRPAHWLDDKGGSFHNPWPSFRPQATTDVIKLVATAHQFPPVPKDINTLLPIRKPTWGAGLKRDKEGIVVTWLAHACFLVEFPTREEGLGKERGVRVLFDPVFSERCSPSQWVGPKRFTKPPCKVEEIPEVDAIVISHNHYDHLDTATLRTLFKRSRKPHIFAPLGNGAYFRSLGVPESHTHILDWWGSRRVQVTVPSSGANGEGGKGTTRTVSVDITCTPAQHFTGRGLFDNCKSLWASWVVEEVVDGGSVKGEPSGVSTREPVKVFFGGDTGYRTVHDGEDEESMPRCPAFKEIGERFGGFDFAMLPIGAYMPRQLMSPVHCAPNDSVQLFKDIRAKRALGMHWGTWNLTPEGAMEPPRRLAEECKNAGIEDGAFGVCELGETLFF